MNDIERAVEKSYKDKEYNDFVNNLPHTNGMALVKLSDLHQILVDVVGMEKRNEVFEQIFDKNLLIGAKDIGEAYVKKVKRDAEYNFDDIN